MAANFNCWTLPHVAICTGCFTASYLLGGVYTTAGVIASGFGTAFLSHSLTPLHRLARPLNANHQFASQYLQSVQETFYYFAAAQVLTGTYRYFSGKSVSIIKSFDYKQ